MTSRSTPSPDVAPLVRVIRDDEKPVGWTRQSWEAAVDAALAAQRGSVIEEVRAALMAGHPGRGENHRYCGPFPDDCLAINETLDALVAR